MKRLFNFPAFAREAFWIGFGIAFSILALLVGTRFLTQLLSTDEYGRMALAVSIATLAIHIFGEPVGKTAIRFYAVWREAGKSPGFLQRLGKSLLRATGCIVIVSTVGVAANYYTDIFPNNYVVVITGVFAILLMFNRVGLALEDAARKRKFRGIVQGGFDVMRFGFAATQQLLLKLSSEMRTDLLAVLWSVVAGTAMLAYVIGAHFWQLKGIVAAVTIVNVMLVLFLLVFLEKNFNQERILE